MLTRQGRRSPDEEEKIMDAALRDAGLLEEGMSLDVKREYYEVIQQSKEGQSPDRTSAQGSPDHDLRDSFSRLSTSKRQETEAEEPHIFEDLDNNRPSTVTIESTSKNKDDTVIVEDRGSNVRNRLSLSLNKETSVGRGRAKPTKYKYPPLPLKSPGLGQKCNTPSNSASVSKEAERISRPLDHPGSPQSNLQNETPNLSPTSPQVPSDIEKSLLESPKETSSKDTELLEETEENKHEIVDIESLSQDEKQENSKPASPVENVLDDNVPPPQTVLLGKRSCHASPFENLLRPVPNSLISLFIKDLEKHQGDKASWLKHAKEVCQTARYEFFDKLLEENPQWGPPISDTGLNHQTLFRQSVPKYSKLFGNSTDQPAVIRTERQSKVQAMSKIHESSSEWAEPDFHSLRRAKQRDLKEDTSGNRPQKRGTETYIDDEDCMESPSESSGEIWPSSRTEQKKKASDSDSEASPDSPIISGPHDQYEFREEEWNTSTGKNRSKNNRKGGKLNQVDIEMEGKPMASAPAQRGQHSKSLRLKRGAISRPSEHATPGNNTKNRGASAEQFDDTNTNNNRWLSSNQSGNQSDIPTQKFYSPKVGQRKNPASSIQRKYSREIKNPDDLLSTPSSSGSMHGRQHDVRSEEAVVEKTECPICGKSFPSVEIEAHSSGCDDWQGAAEGERLLDEVQSKGGSDKIAKVTSKGESSSSDGENLSACDQCNQLFSQNLLSNHTKECRGNPSVSSSGHKRGNSPERDDGPAKKSSRLGM
ncbi:Zinc finger protein 474 [Frankliniella fusca]|uniref:Zinc finger protein 474 n=1 Tax=Frankliniella fusca TaxID=407009 RepID=A0AAE1LAV6_9NEOP|nr:Zinc finger protein 474 [Frankliniella fusca]